VTAHFIGEIDPLLASPECTNHSPAKGSRRRSEISRQTSNYVLNFARRPRPRWIVFENVVQLRAWRGYEPLIGGLKDLGYLIQPQFLDAADFGVTQTRRGLFIICDRDHVPQPVKSRCRKQRTAEELIQLDGTWPTRPLFASGRARPTLERAARAIEALGKFVPFLIVYYGSDRADGWQSK
jgi:DNA (cytosine-5)-methyltransferase 1